jgi:hypothetical protein
MSFLDQITNLPQTILKSVLEIHSLIPDSILFGSLLLYFLTHHLAIGVFSIFLMEMIGSHRLISWIFSQTVGPSRSSMPLTCRAGFKTPQYQYQRIFSHEAYPSYSVFSVGAIATYLGLSTAEFAPTMDEMGREWSTRSTVAYSFIGTFLLAFLIARSIGCESFTEILISVILSFIVGLLFYYANRALFGVESVNFLGLPYMVRKDEKGSPIYVCSPTGSSSS